MWLAVCVLLCLWNGCYPSNIQLSSIMCLPVSVPNQKRIKWLNFCCILDLSRNRDLLHGLLITSSETYSVTVLTYKSRDRAKVLCRKTEDKCIHATNSHKFFKRLRMMPVKGLKNWYWNMFSWVCIFFRCYEILWEIGGEGEIQRGRINLMLIRHLS